MDNRIEIVVTPRSVQRMYGAAYWYAVDGRHFHFRVDAERYLAALDFAEAIGKLREWGQPPTAKDKAAAFKLPRVEMVSTSDPRPSIASTVSKRS